MIKTITLKYSESQFKLMAKWKKKFEKRFEKVSWEKLVFAMVGVEYDN